MKTVLLAFCFLIACNNNKTNYSATDSLSVASDTGTTIIPDVKKWLYKSDTDKMDGSVNITATKVSSNSMILDFPYNHGTTLGLIIRKKNKENEVLISTNDAQFQSYLSDDAYIRMKFDDEKPQNLRYSEAADGSSDVIFPDNSALIIRKLKNVKHVIIEVPFYQNGRKQFDFNVSNLQWQY